MLKRSRTATLALGSRTRLRSVNSLSLVHVMWTPPSILSLRAAWDAVFRSWISWAWGRGGGERHRETVRDERERDKREGERDEMRDKRDRQERQRNKRERQERDKRERQRQE